MRLKYHFEPGTGWINDPNGLIYFKGKYHAFFQHNPYAPVWGTMHWGHAVSSDLVNWEELPIALYPDKEYENSGGCFSGSAIEKDGKMYIFYTSVSEHMGQTQSLAISEDGVTFEKYEGNPIIKNIDVTDFRDPKVTKLLGRYYMVCGSGSDNIGRVLLYVSDDLYHWESLGIMLEGENYGRVIECPDFFELNGKYILMFSQVKTDKYNAVKVVIGSFDGVKFTPENEFYMESGPDFYAAQSFEDQLGRRIMIGWMINKRQYGQEGLTYAGALTIPRELRLKDGVLKNYPVKEAQQLLKNEDELVKICGNTVRVGRENEYISELDILPGEDIAVLHDTRTIEVFVGKGRRSASLWV